MSTKPTEQGATPEIEDATLRPWTVNESKVPTYERVISVVRMDDKGTLFGICKMDGGGSYSEKVLAEVRANAALICKAVNAHDALVDSATLAVTVLTDSEADEWAKSHAIAALNKALALTETEAGRD